MLSPHARWRRTDAPSRCGKRGQQVQRWLERRGRRAVRPRESYVPTQCRTRYERARMKELEREVRELRRANEILRKASGVFVCAGGARLAYNTLTNGEVDIHRMDRPHFQSVVGMHEDFSWL